MKPLVPQDCSINTATLGFKAPISIIIDDVASHGFGAIAPWRRELAGEEIRAVARHVRDAGLKVNGYCRSGPIPASSAEQREACHQENCKALREAAELEAQCFVIVAGGLPKGSRDIESARDQLADGLERLLREAEALGVPLAVEPLHPMYAADRCCINTLHHALDLCDAVDPDASRKIGVAIDAYHVWWDPMLRDGVARAGAGNRIMAFHICDWLVPTRDLLMDRGMMGDGVIRLHEMRQMVTEAGYRGVAEIEIFSDHWQTVDNTTTLQTCAERVSKI